jgi:hypothetical protein
MTAMFFIVIKATLWTVTIASLKIAVAEVLELRVSSVASEIVCESSVNILHYRNAVFRKRRNQRVQGTVVKSGFGKGDDVYVKFKLSSKAVNDRGLPRARSSIKEVAAAERNPLKMSWRVRCKMQEY